MDMLLFLLYFLLDPIFGHDACEPKFVPASFSHKISEDLEPGRPIGKLLFYGDEPLVTYELLNTYDNQSTDDRIESYFQVNSKRLMLIKKLDHEKWLKEGRRNPFILPLKCTFNPTRKTVIHNLSIELIDVNDNAPHLVNVPYFISIDKASKPNTVIVSNIQAVDEDVDKNGNVTIRIDDNSPFKSYFDVHMTDHNRGNLVLKKVLSDMIDSRIRLTLKAEDNGYNSLSSIATLNIAITDTSQRKPTFARVSYLVELSGFTPKNSVVTPTTGSIRAFVDKSTPLDHTVSYSIIDRAGKCSLSIDSLTGTLRYNGLPVPPRSTYYVKACAGGTSMCEKVPLTLIRADTNLSQNITNGSLSLSFDIVKESPLPNAYFEKEYLFLGRIDANEKLDVLESSITVSCNNTGKPIIRVSEQSSRNVQLLVRKYHDVPAESVVQCRVSFHDRSDMKVTYDIFLNILQRIRFEKKKYFFEMGNSTARHSIVGQVKAVSSKKPKLVYTITDRTELTKQLCIAEYGTLYWCQSPPTFLNTRSIDFEIGAAYSGMPGSTVSVNGTLIAPLQPEPLMNPSSSADYELLYLFLGSLICVIALSLILSSLFICFYRQFSDSDSSTEIGSLDVYDDLIKYTNRHDSSVMIMPLLRNYGNRVKRSTYERTTSQSSLNDQYAKLNVVKQGSAICSYSKKALMEILRIPVVDESFSSAAQSNSSRLSTLSRNRPRDSLNSSNHISDRRKAPPPITPRHQRLNNRDSVYVQPNVNHRLPTAYLHAQGIMDPESSELHNAKIVKASNSLTVDSVHSSSLKAIEDDYMTHRGMNEKDRSIDQLTFIM